MYMHRTFKNHGLGSHPFLLKHTPPSNNFAKYRDHFDSDPTNTIIYIAQSICPIANLRNLLIIVIAGAVWICLADVFRHASPHLHARTHTPCHQDAIKQNNNLEKMAWDVSPSSAQYLWDGADSDDRLPVWWSIPWVCEAMGPEVPGSPCCHVEEIIHLEYGHYDALVGLGCALTGRIGRHSLWRCHRSNPRDRSWWLFGGTWVPPGRCSCLKDASFVPTTTYLSAAEIKKTKITD